MAGSCRCLLWSVLVGALICISASSTAAEKPSGALRDGPALSGSSDPQFDSRVVGYINELIGQKWRSSKVRPSPRAEDGEFLRRAYLDIVGHIPPLEVTHAFLRSRDPEKRGELVLQLFEDEDYVRHWTTLWAQLLIGRETPQRVSRSGLEKWLRESLAHNKPYDQFVSELVSATGDFRENGAVNYLLSHLGDNGDATPATGRTARLFLGVQVQCTQCHDHPFNAWKQDQFWSFNAFFRQADRRDRFAYNEKTGRNEFVAAELVNGGSSGPVYFERRSALMSVAFPRFVDGTQIDDGPDTDRRTELARLLRDRSKPWLSQAIVNRMWGHFLGSGFTKPVDDMGPHNPPTHPELLERLAADFVASGHDVKRLIRWITASDAYQLSSRFHAGNREDDPSSGKPPLFSRVYVKQMTAEQLYDSLLVATQAHQAGRASWEAAEKQRQEWLRQFVVVFGTDDNDETTTFNGTIPQALMMMNGALMEEATGAEPGSFLRQVLEKNASDEEKIQELFLAALCRHGTPRELAAMKRIVTAYGSDRLAAFQDAFWAVLNSNEFILNH